MVITISYTVHKPSRAKKVFSKKANWALEGPSSIENFITRKGF